MDTIASPQPATDPAGQALNRDALLARGKAVLHTEAAAISDAEARLGDAFVGAVNLVLAASGRVCVTGVGKAGLVGNKIAATLASTGTPSYSLHPVEALHGDLGMVRPEDVVLALSKSGSSELVELLPRLREMGCRVILITANLESKAAKHADFVLDIGRTDEACPLGLAPSSSTAAMLALGDALALTAMEAKNVCADEYASYHPGGALGRFLIKVRELMRTGSDCPIVPESATLRRCFDVIRTAPHRAGAAIIVDGEGRLTGIVTHGDIFRLIEKVSALVDKPVGEVMTKNPKRIGLNERAVDALRLMRKHSIDELPVVDAEDRVVGLVDIQDLLSRGYSVFDMP
jgi:arabinose-5-phosphate isomerase